MTPARYSLVWCDPEGVPDGPDAMALRDWFRQGRPAIVRRPGSDEPVGTVPLAITLPNRLDRRRVGFAIPDAQVLRSQPPPLLGDALASAPAPWRAGWPLGLMERARVHGGLMWQHLTGETYLRPGSDIDILIVAESVASLAAIEPLLRRVEDRRDPRLDGEILFPRGGAVPWREWISGVANLLVKRQDGVFLMERQALLAELVPKDSDHAMSPA